MTIDNLAPHVAVFDMPTALAFYRDLLGFVVVNQSEPGDETNWCMLQLGEAVIMLNTAYEKSRRPPTADAVRQGWHADVTFYLMCRDVDAVYQHLLRCGVQPAPPATSWYGMYQLHLKDPDGYQLCFQRRAATVAPT